MAKDRRDWEKQKAEIKKKKKMTKFQFLKLSHSHRWEVVPLLTNVQWCCEYCDCVVDGGKRPEREIFPKAERCCGNCDKILTRRTGGGQHDPFGYYPKLRK